MLYTRVYYSCLPEADNAAREKTRTKIEMRRGCARKRKGQEREKSVRERSGNSGERREGDQDSAPGKSPLFNLRVFLLL